MDEARKRRLRRGLLAALVLLPPLLAAYAFWIEPYWIQVTRHETGEGPREIKIVHLTDLHFKTEGSRERRVLEILEEEKPDLIVITGDSITDGFDPEAFTAFLSRIRAPLGVFACRGNWEDWYSYSIPCFAEGGVRLLEDQSEALPRTGLEIVGLRSARSPVPSGTAPLRIALCHYPIILPSASKKGVDLVFAGHTHGGQVRLPFFGALTLPFDCGRYEAGWYAEGTCRMYVSRGIGTSILGVRFNCRPEVAVHRIRYGNLK
jgi:predicted MPP superfamily phosphohydrolase